MKKTLRNKKGFTLAELLIVVAIIAVLVAIAIPIFSSQLEKAREATDLANIRAAYAECASSVLTEEATTGVDLKEDGSASKSVKLTQTKQGWTGKATDEVSVAGINIRGEVAKAEAPKGTEVTVTVTAAGVVKIADK